MTKQAWASRAVTAALLLLLAVSSQVSCSTDARLTRKLQQRQVVRKDDDAAKAAATLALQQSVSNAAVARLDTSLSCPNAATVSIMVTRQAGAVSCETLVSNTFLVPALTRDTAIIPGSIICQVNAEAKVTTAVAGFANATGAILFNGNLGIMQFSLDFVGKLGLTCAAGVYTDSLQSTAACPTDVLSRVSVLPPTYSCSLAPLKLEPPPPAAAPPPPPPNTILSGPCTACVTMYKQAGVNLARDCPLIANTVFNGPTSVPYVQNTGLIPQAGYTCEIKDPFTIQVCATFMDTNGAQLFIIQFDQTARATNLVNTYGLGCGPNNFLDSLIANSPTCITATSNILADKATCLQPIVLPPTPPSTANTVEVYMLSEAGGMTQANCTTLASALILDPFTSYGLNMPVGGSFKCDPIAAGGKTIRLSATFASAPLADKYVADFKIYAPVIKLADVMGLRCWGSVNDYISVKSLPTNLLAVAMPSACAVQDAQAVISMKHTA